MATAATAGAAPLTGAALHAAWEALVGRSHHQPSTPTPWHGQCILYLAGSPCNPRSCTGRHDAKPLRPVCRQFLQDDSCARGDDCWLPHVAPTQAHPAGLILQASGSHAERLEEYVLSLYGSATARFAGGGDCAVRGAVRRRAHGLSKHRDAVLLLDVGEGADGAAAAGRLAGHLREDPIAGIALRRVHPVQLVVREAGEAAGGLPAVVDFMLARMAALGAPSVTARVHGYPAGCEAELLDALDALQAAEGCVAPPGGGGAPPAPAPAPAPVPAPCHPRTGAPLPFRLALSRGAARYDVLLTLVRVDGHLYAGAVPRGDPLCAVADYSGATRDAERAVCRAFYKLREVTRRTGLLGAPPPPPPPLPLGAAPAPPRVAIDVGAAPGGWSSYLAAVAGFDRVLAIDPGELDTASGRLPGGGAVEHLRCRAQDALPALLAGERGELAGRVGAYVCDMNAPTGAVVDAFLAAAPLLAPGAAVVLTLKNFDGNLGAWRRNCDAAVRRVADACGATPGGGGSGGSEDGGGVRVIHLLANGPVEVTLTAVFRPHGGGAAQQAVPGEGGGGGA